MSSYQAKNSRVETRVLIRVTNCPEYIFYKILFLIPNSLDPGSTRPGGDIKLRIQSNHPLLYSNFLLMCF
jgi:hypothetical protein